MRKTVVLGTGDISIETFDFLKYKKDELLVFLSVKYL